MIIFKPSTPLKSNHILKPNLFQHTERTIKLRTFHKYFLLKIQYQNLKKFYILYYKLIAVNLIRD